MKFYKSASAFWKAKLIFINEKKRQRSKYISETFEIKKGQRSENIALEIAFGFFFKYEK